MCNILLLLAHHYLTRILLWQCTSLGEWSRAWLLCANLKGTVVQHELIIHTPIYKHWIIVLDRGSALIQVTLVLAHEHWVLYGLATARRNPLAWAVWCLSRVSCDGFARLLIRLEVAGAVARGLLLAWCHLLICLVVLHLVYWGGGLLRLLLLRLEVVIITTTSGVGACSWHILLYGRLVFYLASFASDHTSAVWPLLFPCSSITTWRTLIWCEVWASAASTHFKACDRAPNSSLSWNYRRLCDRGGL